MEGRALAGGAYRQGQRKEVCWGRRGGLQTWTAQDAQGLHCRGHGALPREPMTLRLFAGSFSVCLWPLLGGDTGWRGPHESPSPSSLRSPWAQPPPEHLFLLNGSCPCALLPPPSHVLSHPLLLPVDSPCPQGHRVQMPLPGSLP